MDAKKFIYNFFFKKGGSLIRTFVPSFEPACVTIVNPHIVSRKNLKIQNGSLFVRRPVSGNDLAFQIFDDFQNFFRSRFSAHFLLSLNVFQHLVFFFKIQFVNLIQNALRNHANRFPSGVNYSRKFFPKFRRVFTDYVINSKAESADDSQIQACCLREGAGCGKWIVGRSKKVILTSLNTFSVSSPRSFKFPVLTLNTHP